MFFGNNIKYLRKNAKLKQDEMLASIGIPRATWSNYELNQTQPDFNKLLEISKFFGVTTDDLLRVDLQKGNLNENNVQPEMSEKGNLNCNLKGNLNEVLPSKKESFKEFKLTIAAEDQAEYDVQNGLIPITDISVAAGAGTYNNEYIENLETIKLPPALMRKNATYLCVRIKGISMAPTLQDGGYAIIRLLDRSEWAKMQDERLYVVSDNEGKTALKRVKNRFKQGFIVMRSDSPDRAVYPSYNLQVEDINTIWYVEWYLSAKMPNIHDQYYTRLQRLEDEFEDFKQLASKMNPKEK